VAAYTAEARFAWQVALRRLGTQTHAQSIEEDIPLLTLDLWVVVLGDEFLLTRGRRWLRQLNAPTLLLSPHGSAALRATEAVRYPVLICAPATAWHALAACIELLMDISSGRVVIHGGIPARASAPTAPRQ